MRRVLFIAFALLVVLAGAVAWFVRDADRFKPALAAHLERTTGVRIEIAGDLAWRLMPRPWLAAGGLHATHEGRAWSAERLEVRPDLFSLVRNPGTPKGWRIEEAVVRQLAVEDAGDRVEASRLSVRNIGLGNPAPVEARIVYAREGRQLFETDLAGVLTVEADRFSARDLSFRMPGAAGNCDLQAMPNGKLWPPRAPTENEILPVGIMRAYDWDGRCEIERIEQGGEAIENVVVVLDNKEGGSIVSVDAPEFLGGKAQLEAVVRADVSPMTWDLRPVLLGVDSNRLAAWLRGNSMIAAPVDYGGTIRMSGNTPAALAASVDASTRFATRAGAIDSSAFAVPLVQAAALLDSRATASSLPATLDYESLNGVWAVDGERHRLDLALDSLAAEAEGDYIVLEDRLEFRGVVAPGKSAEQWGLPLGPDLAGVSFYFRCEGSSADPGCRLDVERTLLGVGAAKGSAVVGDLIDTHVPDEYRDAARSFLDSLETGVDAALSKTPQELIEDQVPEQYRGLARSLLDTLDEATDEKDR